MWDFSLGKAFGLMLRTLPFIGFRLAIYFGITLAYLIATSGGAGIGYMIGSILRDAESDPSGSVAFWGGLIGFGIVSGVLYFAREYLLYIVKAGHIAVLVRLIDDQPIPEGTGQIGYATQIVKSRFAEASVLFGIDQIIKSILRTFNATVLTISSFLPIPGLTNVMEFVTAVINFSLTYVDEAILAYMIRTNPENAWAGARDGVIFYAQNYRMMLKNAVFLTILAWIVSFVIFLVVIAPVAALVSMMPGLGGFWTLIIAIIAAYALKAALIDPFAMVCIVQVYFKAIEGQTPSPEWVDRLNSVAAPFRELSAKAAAFVPGPGGASVSVTRVR
jgi:hypothetical protein